MNELELAPLFQNHMVIQRDKPVIVWGRGPNDARVKVIFDGSEGTCIVKNHQWRCILPAHSPAMNLTLTVKTDIPKFPVKTIKDVAVGDVWIAAGQSNMEYFLRYDAHWEEIKRQPRNGKIRMFNVPRLAFEGHQKDISDSGYWFFEGDNAWESFSAPGYCFAREIQPHIGVPVGIVGCNWGGSNVGAWIDERYLQEPPYDTVVKEYEAAVYGKDMEKLRQETLYALAFEDGQKHQEEWKAMMYGLSEEEQRLWQQEHGGEPCVPMGPWHYHRPAGLFHQMVEKIAPFSIKGVLWYQGESDEHHAKIYDKLLERMIVCWRRAWQDDFPFLLVQLAPFCRWLDCAGKNYPEVRRRQEMAAERVPDVYMTSIMDLGMYEDIHPKHKKEVGGRLALLARGCIYGEDILCQPPKLLSGSYHGHEICLQFEHSGDGLYIKEKYEENMPERSSGQYDKMSGDDAKKFCGLKVCADGREIGISSVSAAKDCIFIKLDADVKESLTVSFAEIDYMEVNVFNSAGLPVCPFHWEYSL